LDIEIIIQRFTDRLSPAGAINRRTPVFRTILHANNGSDSAFQALSTALHLEIFAQGLALGKDTYDAARDAGYNQNASSFEANARQPASFPEVKARIRELQERAIEKKTTVSIAWLMERLTEVAGVPLNPAKVRTSDKLRAIELIAKVRGYFAPESGRLFNDWPS
jgi:hypothetical protein